MECWYFLDISRLHRFRVESAQLRNYHSSRALHHKQAQRTFLQYYEYSAYLIRTPFFFLQTTLQRRKQFVTLHFSVIFLPAAGNINAWLSTLMRRIFHWKNELGSGKRAQCFAIQLVHLSHRLPAVECNKDGSLSSAPALSAPLRPLFYALKLSKKLHF